MLKRSAEKEKESRRRGSKKGSITRKISTREEKEDLKWGYIATSRSRRKIVR